MITASHPSRVRGLKYLLRQQELLEQVSHPSRVRGLKYCLLQIPLKFAKSHPSRVRGLKFRSRRSYFCDGSVAPFTGAWIEIERQVEREKMTEVAPFTGAWIEIIM